MSDDNDLQWVEPAPRSWACYHAGPIDHAWRLLPTVDEMAQKLARNEDPDCHRLIHFLDDFNGAKDIARTKGWEGDFAQGPHVFTPAIRRRKHVPLRFRVEAEEQWLDLCSLSASSPMARRPSLMWRVNDLIRSPESRQG